MYTEISLKNELIIPVLKMMGDEFLSSSSVNLLYGTCAQESHLGKWRRQIGGGGALSIYQIEKPTFEWLYNSKYHTLILSIVGERKFEDLEDDDTLVTIICRLRYYVIFAPLPAAGDTEGLAKYWKEYYNTKKGKGTESEFILNYGRFLDDE